jgi:DNA-binding transcriptional MerR regulator
MLGVNPATLRQWTSSGKIRVYRTPGGHRRYSTAEIAALSRMVDQPPDQSLTTSIIEQLRTRYRGMGHSQSAQPTWLDRLEPATREHFHGLGDELLERLGEYLTARGPRPRQRALSRGWEIAEEYGQVAREAGLDTSQAVDAYLRYRRPVLDVLARSLAAHPQLSTQLGRIMRDAERFMDEVLSGVARGGSQIQGAPVGE